MATKRTRPPNDEIDRAARIIMHRLVNRSDRWGVHWIKDGKVVNGTAPSQTEVAKAKKAGKRRMLSRTDLKRHIRQMFTLNKGMPLGVHCISTENTCKWIAWDIDNHGSRIPEKVTKAARDAIFQFVRNKLGLRCVVEDSGGGGWHIWVPLAKPADSTEAHLMVHRVRAVGAKVWPAEVSEPKIDAYPQAAIHNGPTHKENCGGGWLRLPGRHQRVRDHVSAVVGKRRFGGLSVWNCFDRVASYNTPAKWRTALREARRLPPVSRKLRVSTTGNGRRDCENPSTEVDVFDYGDWTLTKLCTKPLGEGERRCRERRLVRALVLDKHKSLDLTEEAVRALYDRASGDSKDLADPQIRDTLYSTIPEMVLRIVGAQGHVWASRAEADRARRLYVEAAERRERARRARYRLRSSIAEHFTEWLDGLYRKLRHRADIGGPYFLSTTILTCRPQKGSTRGPHDFFLRDCHGVTRIKIVPQARVPGRGGRRSAHWVTEDKHKLFMRILCATKIDGTTRVRIVRPAVWSNRDNTLPAIIDASKLPIDQP